MPVSYYCSWFICLFVERSFLGFGCGDWAGAGEGGEGRGGARRGTGGDRKEIEKEKRWRDVMCVARAP